MSLRLSKHGQTSDIFGTQANSTSEAGKTRMRDTRNQPKVGDECLWLVFGDSGIPSLTALKLPCHKCSRQTSKTNGNQGAMLSSPTSFLNVLCSPFDSVRELGNQTHTWRLV
ncbi:hypothetical protein B0H11DRAFT_2200266 [Mycena galericulata]|nr:hypothetical protein B0H11DRAFT_2200266 [Mycena galericulata]